MNDEEAIKQALLAELGWSDSQMQFTLGRMDGRFAEGGVSEAGGGPGGAMWLAAKDNGRWVILFHGQDNPPRDVVDASSDHQPLWR